MLPSSAIRIIESTPSRLVVWDPPYYGLGIGLLVVAVIGAALWLVPRSQGGERRFSWWLVVVIAPFVLGGLGLLTSHTQVVLSSADNTAKIESRYFLFFHSDRVFPLDQLQRVSVETSEGYRSLAFVLRSGQTFTLGGFMDRPGYYEAEASINNFLASSSPASHP